MTTRWFNLIHKISYNTTYKKRHSRRYSNTNFFMTKVLLLLFCFLSVQSFGQKDAVKWVRAFPITDYIVDLSDSVKVIQIKLPDGTLVSEKQAGLLRGVYRDKQSDTIVIGTGRCHLIKGDYYYFTINYKKSGKLPKGGDLLFTLVERTPIYYGNIARLASYFIELQSVYENPFYDRYNVFSHWEKSDEESLVDSLVSDIHFTANYFLETNPEMNVKIKGGSYDGKMVLNTMKTCSKTDVTDFLEYMIVRPRLYTGRQWKISEIFATWLSEGSPTVIKN